MDLNDLTKKFLNFSKNEINIRKTYQEMTKKDIIKVYNERRDNINKLSSLESRAMGKFTGRKITSVKLFKDSIIFATCDGQIGTIYEDKIDSIEKICDSNINSIVFDEENLFFTSFQGDIFIKRGNSINKINITHFRILKTTFHEKLKVFAFVDCENNLILYDLESNKNIFSKKYTKEINSIDFHIDGNLLLFSNGNSDVLDLRCMDFIMRFDKLVNKSIFMKNGYEVVCGKSNGVVNSWDMRKTKNFGCVLAHSCPLKFIKEQSNNIFSYSADGKILLSSPMMSTIHKEWYNDSDILSMDIDNKSMIVVSSDKTYKIFRTF